MEQAAILFLSSYLIFTYFAFVRLWLCQLSLAEAKSLWALIQHRDFFTAFVLRHTTLSTPISSFCGDRFAVGPRPSTPLYRLPWPMSWCIVAVELLAWFAWPSWPTRARHAVALLEFALELESGSFLVCDASTALFGVDDMGGVKLASWNHIYSRHELRASADSRSCHTDADCVLTSPYCHSSCDSRTQKCTLPRSAVSTICQLVEPYLLPLAPRVVGSQAVRLLSQCTALNASATNSPVHCVTELKSLLQQYVLVSTPVS